MSFMPDDLSSIAPSVMTPIFHSAASLTEERSSPFPDKWTDFEGSRHLLREP
jgi:hypothetical protein